MQRTDAAAPARPAVPWGAVRAVGGAAVLAFLLWRLGSGPFIEGLRMIDAWALVAALGVGAVTIVACAWRWRIVALGLGLRLPLRTAVANYYRSVLLNATLPGGVLGDVDRAVGHGRDAGDVSRGIRAVVWERTAGQVVQCVLALALLWLLPSPVRPFIPWLAAAAVVLALGAALLARLASGRGPARWRRAMRTLGADVRAGLLARRVWPGVVLTSAVAVAGHLVTFVVAARTAGLTLPVAQLVPLTLLALLAMGIPANVGGFGPREGVAAWAFSAAGLTAAQGVATAMVYGALMLVASLPGVVMLVFRRFAVAG
jgi:uncharacterized membrane protein YbhN (UPF0104 family)